MIALECHSDGLNALKKRIVENYELLEVIEKKLISLRAGISGEKRLSDVFQKYTYSFPIKVLMNVNLNAGGKFQIDCLVLTEYYALVLESKNFSGILNFEQNPERLVRQRDDGRIDVYESPEVQVERNCIMLQHWLQMRGFQLPVLGAIVFTSNQHPIIEKGSKRIPSLFCKTIPVFLSKKKEEYQQKKRVISIEKLCDLIRQENLQNTFLPFPLCERWKIDVEQLKRGVHCLNCSQFGMKKEKKGWVCTACGSLEKNAHIRTIKEWFMLVKPTITNKECRDWLLIDNRHVTKRLLKSCGLEEEGSTKGTIYKWKWTIE